MEIRPAIESDVPVLASLNAHVHDLHVQAEPDLYRPTRREEVEAWFREVLDDDAAEILLAVLAGDVVGYVIANVVRHPGHTYVAPQTYLLVDQMAVVPANRRCGVGRMLMEAIHEQAREEGLDRVELAVRAHNRDALLFYESLGYAPVKWRMGRSV